MRPLRAAWILPLALGACAAPAQWEKPGATPEVIQADTEGCQSRSAAAAGSMTYSTLPAQALTGAATIPGLPVGSEDARLRQEQAFGRCMRDKGYSATK